MQTHSFHKAAIVVSMMASRVLKVQYTERKVCASYLDVESAYDPGIDSIGQRAWSHNVQFDFQGAGLCRSGRTLPYDLRCGRVVDDGSDSFEIHNLGFGMCSGNTCFWIGHVQLRPYLRHGPVPFSRVPVMTRHVNAEKPTSVFPKSMFIHRRLDSQLLRQHQIERTTCRH